MRLMDYIKTFVRPLCKRKIFWLLICISIILPVIQIVDILILGSGIDAFGENFSRAAAIMLLYVFVLVLTLLINVGTRIIQEKIEHQQNRIIRDKVYHKLLICDWKWWIKQDTGEYKILFTDQLREMLSDSMTLVVKFFEVFIGGIGAVITAFAIQPIIATVICIYFPISVFLSLRIGKGCLKTHEAKQNALRVESGIIANTLRGLKEIVLAQKEKVFIGQCEEGILGVKKAKQQHLNKVMQYRVAEEVAKAVGYVGIFLLGFYFYKKHNMPMGSIIVLLKLSDILFLQLSQINYVYDLFNSVKGYYQIFSDFFLAPEMKFGTIEPKNIAEDVFVLENIGFSYDITLPVFLGFSCSVLEGKHIAVTGKSGCGKTTLVHLLCRLYDPDEGSVSFCGMDLRDLSYTGIHKNIGVVNQFPYIFQASCYENIIWGLSDIKMEKVIEAVRFSGFMQDDIYEFLSRPAGEGGNLLSGGEKQRIAIARCFLRDNPIIIMDEPTAMIDAATEDIIMRNIQNLWREKTVIIVTHEKRYFDFFDEVIEL